MTSPSRSDDPEDVPDTFTMSTPTTPRKLVCLNFVNIFAYIVNIVVTYGIGVGGVFDLPTNDELSAKYQTLVTPIGWTFAIWGLIFALQAMWAIVPLVVSKQRDNPFLYAVGTYYLGVCIAQTAWTIFFSMEVIWASLISMLVIAVFLWRIVWVLSGTSSAYKGSLANYILWRLPFSIHTGWITAAAFVNANVYLVDLGVGSTLQFYAALFSLFSILVIASLTTLSLDIIIPLVLSWALFGIFVELSNPNESIGETFTDGQIETCLWGSLVFAVLTAIGFLVGSCWQCFQKRSNPGESDANVYVRAE